MFASGSSCGGSGGLLGEREAGFRGGVVVEGNGNVLMVLLL